MASSEKLALIIGVDSYFVKSSSGKVLDQLPSSRKDAQDISRVLKERDFSLFGSSPLIGSELHQRNGFIDIHDSIRDFFKKSTVDQLLLFYFSGHGIAGYLGNKREIYLATPQVIPDNPLNQGFSMSVLTELVRIRKQ